MKSDRLLILACAATLVLALLFSCSNQLAGGDVTETGNARVFGKVVDSLGNGKKNVHVQLLPSYFDPVHGGIPLDSLSTTTDDNGNYTIITSIIGDFNIEVINPISGDRALIHDIAIKLNDTIHNENAILKKTGTIKIVLPSDSGSDALYAYIPGTTRFGTVNGRIVIIDSVPAGTFTTLCYVNKADTAENRTLKKDFSVTSGYTAIIVDDQSWLFSRKLYLNTTSSGAAVNTNVYSFPILIRLLTGNFDFSQAKKGGEDIRFAKSNGDPIPFEIERWDSSAGQAEIWAKIDTVYGNDSTQSITMYWGASTGSATPSLSNGAKVFDTADGFQGVWHLSEQQGAINRDATVNGFNGVQSTSGPLAVSGMIGGAQQFNGTSNYIDVPGSENSKLSFPENSAYTVSAWVLVDSIDNLFHAIVDKSDLQYGLEVYGPDNKWDFYQLNSAKTWDGSRTPATAKKWVYLTGVRSGNEQCLYVNGSYAVGIFESTTSPRARDEGGTVRIGMLSNDPETRFFKGKIDEVRLANTARSANWIKLCYMNQNAEDLLITFSK
jgi:hypothetical protein